MFLVGANCDSSAIRGITQAQNLLIGVFNSNIKVFDSMESAEHYVNCFNQCVMKHNSVCNPRNIRKGIITVMNAQIGKLMEEQLVRISAKKVRTTNDDMFSVFALLILITVRHLLLTRRNCKITVDMIDTMLIKERTPTTFIGSTIKKVDVCTFCCKSKSRDNKMFACGGCGVAAYCNRGCQSSDWARHKPMCSLFR